MIRAQFIFSKVIIILLLFICHLSSPAFADYSGFQTKKYGSFIKFDGIPDALFLFDDIKDGDSFALRRALRDKKIKTIVLASPGGLVQEGLLMAGIIHDNELTTFIPIGEECASACSYMFFAGNTRISKGALGVHQISLGEKESKKVEEIGKTEMISQYAVSEIIGFLTDFKTPPFVYEKMFQQKDMYYFSREELNEIERVNFLSTNDDLEKIETFLSEFDNFLGLIACVSGKSECTPLQLCQLAYENETWSNDPEAQHLVDKAKDQNLNCRFVLLKAKPKPSGKELVKAIQDELVRLGCLIDKGLHWELFGIQYKFDGTINWASIDGLRYILNFDQTLPQTFVNYENPDFLDYLFMQPDGYCSREIRIYVDDHFFDGYRKQIYASLPLSIVELDGVPVFVREYLFDPYRLAYVWQISEFEKQINWHKLLNEKISYVVKLKPEITEVKRKENISTSVKIFDVNLQKQIGSERKFITTLAGANLDDTTWDGEGDLPWGDGEADLPSYRIGKQISNLVRKSILQRKLDEKIEKRYSQIAEQDGYKNSIDTRMYNVGILKLDVGYYTDACMAFNELREKYPRDYLGGAELEMEELECPQLKESLN